MMKNYILRFISALLLIMILFSYSFLETYAFSNNQASPWAADRIDICAKAGLIPKDFDNEPFTQSITRSDFAELLINSINIYGVQLPKLPASHPFKDTIDEYVEYSYLLGLTKGTSADTFSPDMTLTREMAAVMLSRLLMLFQAAADSTYKNFTEATMTDIISYPQPISTEEAVQMLKEYSVDYDMISEWARAYMADVYSRGILSGTGDRILDPKSNTTREQAAILALNLLTYSDESKLHASGVEDCVLPRPTGIYISKSYKADNVFLRWNAIPSASAYDIIISKNNIPTYNNRISTNYIDLSSDTQALMLYKTIFGADKELINASIKVTPVDSNGKPSIFYLQQDFSISPRLSVNEIITGDPNKNQFSDINEANQSMTSITVRVWNLTASGEKTSSTRTFSINKNIAEDVIKIFEEIYNGDEKFPIKSIGGYSYRDGKSQHSNGTAIDINPEENYFISSNGSIKAGSFWKPGTNPYSILPDGDVVKAFNKYGWHWSPDMTWPNGKDYMHFSLNGK